MILELSLIRMDGFAGCSGCMYCNLGDNCNLQWSKGNILIYLTCSNCSVDRTKTAIEG